MTTTANRPATPARTLAFTPAAGFDAAARSRSHHDSAYLRNWIGRRAAGHHALLLNIASAPRTPSP